MIKSQTLHYEAVMGKKEVTTSDQRQRNAQRFLDLPAAVKSNMETGYARLKDEMKRPFSYKLKQSMEQLFVKTSPFELGWLFFSVVIPILLLLKIEGAVQAVWLLVLMTVGYGVDNQLNAHAKINHELHLFPSEELILQKYVKEPLRSNVFEQESQLKRGWHRYLIDKWAKEPISDEDSHFALQLEKGEFEFTLARINAMKSISDEIAYNSLPEKKSLLLLAIYFAWNLFMAGIVTKSLQSPKIGKACRKQTVRFLQE